VTDGEIAMQDTKTCPCKLRVPIDYSTRDVMQATTVLGLIERLGEYTIIRIGSRIWRVSRHCIALHGVDARRIEEYGFDELFQ
jgi:hypothetical protein